MTVKKIFAVVGFVLLSSNSVAQTRTFFKDIRVFDGLNLLPSTSVLIEGGRITQIGHNFNVPAGTDTILGTGKTLLPGLIDAHAHVYGSALEDAIEAGVTTELDMFTDPTMAADVRKEQEEGKMLDRADLYSAGILVTAPGGHGTEYGFPIPTLSSPDSAQQFVDARLAEGSDYIKIVYDNGGIFGMHIPTLSTATIKAVVNATHKRGRLAVIHIGSLQEARDAIECGVDGLMHVPSDIVADKDFGKLAREHGVFVCPTLSVIMSATGGSNAAFSFDTNIAKYTPTINIGNLQKSFPHSPNATANFNAAAATTKMLQLGHVLILAGSDAPNPGTAHGASVHRELELLVQAGLSQVHALAAATGNPADAFHLRDRGHICIGCRADLLLVNGDPSTDITATRNILGVWKLGHKLDRTPYLAKIASERGTSHSSASTSASNGTDLISDFEDGTTSTKIGQPWVLSIDANLVKGNSDATDVVVDGGANGSKKSLLVKGTIRDQFQYPWAGVMYSPGTASMQPTNLSTKHALHFWAKGDGGTYRVMMYTSHGGYMPAVQKIEMSAAWKEYTMPFSQFDGSDGHDVVSIVICGGPKPGPFEFQLDEVRLD